VEQSALDAKMKSRKAKEEKDKLWVYVPAIWSVIIFNS
jgi:hypothetical protein